MSKQLAQRFRAEDGFTLMELVVAIPMMTLIVAALTLTITYSAGFSSEAQDSSMLQLQARTTLDTMSRDLREAYTGSGQTPVEGLTATTLSFYAPDRLTPFHLRHIWYRFVNGRLQRASVSSTNTGPATSWSWPTAAPVWTDEVVGLTSTAFAGFNGSSPPQPAATLDAIRSVTVDLTTSTHGTKGRSYDFHRTIDIREDASS